MALMLTSPAFKSGDCIPTQYAPATARTFRRHWHGTILPKAKSFLILVEDSDASSGTFRHCDVQHSRSRDWPAQGDVRSEAR
jgi:phosphatidylethanolamine-binding protein (PEBP) family uncharacterized protein